MLAATCSANTADPQYQLQQVWQSAAIDRAELAVGRSVCHATDAATFVSVAPWQVAAAGDSGAAASSPDAVASATALPASSGSARSATRGRAAAGGARWRRGGSILPLDRGLRPAAGATMLRSCVLAAGGESSAALIQRLLALAKVARVSAVHALWAASLAGWLTFVCVAAEYSRA